MERPAGLNRSRELPTALPSHSRANAITRTKISIIWFVPIIAAIVGGVLVFNKMQTVGPTIKLTFQRGDGLQPNETTVRYRGVRVGMVRSVRLTQDGQKVEVQANLDRSAAVLAREGSLFWIVRPELSAGGLRGLQTIVSGSYIEVEPGTGKPMKEFTGAEDAPLAPNLQQGLELVLTTPHVTTLNTGAPVYYRGLEVGSVQSISMNDIATGVNIHLRIDRRYKELVRENSVFWNAGGLDVTLKLFGVNVSAESMRSLIVGGIAFATPSPAGPPATPGLDFALHDKLEEKWLKWDTAIPAWAGSEGPPTNRPNSGFNSVGSIATNATRAKSGD
jgi:paraquat-inducible protein B